MSMPSHIFKSFDNHSSQEYLFESQKSAAQRGIDFVTAANLRLPLKAGQRSRKIIFDKRPEANFDEC